ncbi:hypothetical protein H5410_027265, partial [Solanum commersonii]
NFYEIYIFIKYASKRRYNFETNTVQLSQDSNPEESLVRKIFPSLQQNYRSANYITKLEILASRNEFVDNLNEMMIRKFPGGTKTYISVDSAGDDTTNYYQEDAERKCAHHDAEKSRPLKWFVQWDTINL